MQNGSSCNRSLLAAPALDAAPERFSAIPPQAPECPAPIQDRPAFETSISKCSQLDENSQAALMLEPRRNRNPIAAPPKHQLPPKRLLEPHPTGRSWSRLDPETTAESLPRRSTARSGRCCRPTRQPIAASQA